MNKSIATMLSALLAISATSCATDDQLDSEDSPFPSGKSDGGIDEGSPEALAVLALVNNSSVGFAELDDDARLHGTAAANIILYREGPDGVDGSSDDEVYDDLKELDAVSYVGPVALQKLLDYAIKKGLLDDGAPEPAYYYDIGVKSVWTEVSGTAGKQSLAILDDDAYSHSDHIIIYGEKNNKLSVRDYQGQWWISTHPGNTVSSKDNWYTLEAEFVSATEMTVKLTGKTGSTYDLVYQLQTTTSDLERDATTAINAYYAKYDELRESKVETHSDLMAHIRLHDRTHDFDPNEHWDAYEYQLERFWLQIEGEMYIEEEVPALKDVEIKADGTDAISQHYLAKHDQTAFTSENDLPDPQVILDGWDWLNNDDPEFYVVAEGVEGIVDGPILDGMEKFVTHTFKRMTPFECSGGYDYTPDFTWYLKDGTVLSYWVGPECD